MLNKNNKDKNKKQKVERFKECGRQQVVTLFGRKCNAIKMGPSMVN
jgi:hypothetical protein